MADNSPPTTGEATYGNPTRTSIVTGVALFMISLDNLVVTTALPQIREGLHTTIEGLEWTVNAYTLTFAVLLLTASAVAERFGRRRLFSAGIAVFTAGSVLAALSHGIGLLVAARALQGLGAAVVLPLTLTLLSAAYPPDKRAGALGIWGAIGGLAVALGPVIGGLIIHVVSWQWIFWLNVPIGIVMLVVIPGWLAESRGPARPLDVLGTVLASAGLFGVVLGLVRGNAAGWTSAEVLGSLVGGVVLLAAFLVQQTRTAAPMLPLRMFRDRTFTAVNAVSLLMYFGMFGSIFLITQFLQEVQGAGALGAGVRMLSWTGLTLIGAPMGAVLAEKLGGRLIVTLGLALQAAGLVYLALVTDVTGGYAALVPGFVLNGFGMGLFFGPTANLALSAVSREEEGIASGANNAIRELGGVFGIAVLASVFTSQGGYGSPTAFVDGMHAAVWIGAGIVALGAIAALFIKDAPKAAAAEAPATETPAAKTPAPTGADRELALSVDD
ncbi:MFS transporter [Kitasatospora terrestris]|uniref:MFS transporter n=1 Tax=Kitasatospora terrestris TaxID=258051 RepID=A0ABP9DN72_9ACTN